MMSIDQNVTILNELLDEELNSPIRFLEESMPYVEPEYADRTAVLKEMTVTRRTRCQELINLIDEIGGEPVALHPQREEQYLAFLSLKFLLPQLIEWKNTAILLHERAMSLCDAATDVKVASLIEAHLAQHRSELDGLC